MSERTAQCRAPVERQRPTWSILERRRRGRREHRRWAMYWQVFQVDVQPGRLADFFRGSQAHVDESLREEPGTLAFTYIQDEQNAHRFYVMEQYADRAAQQAHTQGLVMQRNAPGLQPLLAGLVLLASGDQVD